MSKNLRGDVHDEKAILSLTIHQKYSVRGKVQLKYPFRAMTLSSRSVHLELLIRHVLPELLGHPLEVAERNLACLVVVEQPERLQDLFPRVFLALG